MNYDQFIAQADQLDELFGFLKPKPTPRAAAKTPTQTPQQKQAALQKAYGVAPRTSDGRGAKSTVKGLEGPKGNQVGTVNKFQQGQANRAGWQKAIKKAEHGTDHENVYKGRFGTTTKDDGSQTHRGSPVDYNKSHTGEKVKSPWSDRTSAAAGAYQAMPPTWKRYMGDKKMSPGNQDKFMDKEAAGAGVKTTSPVSKENVAKLAPKWASLPNAKGKSQYGQPVKPYEKIEKWHDAGAKKHLGSQYHDAPRSK